MKFHSKIRRCLLLYLEQLLQQHIERLSNFLPWNLAYTELYFCDTLWPDFDETDLDRALDAFAVRERRFGGLAEPSLKHA